MKENNAPKPILLSDYQAPAFWVDTVVLNFILNENITRVESTLTVRRNSDLGDNRCLQLDGSHVTLISIAVDGNLLTAEKYQIDEQGLQIPDLPDAFELCVVTEIEPQNNTALEGLYKSSGNYCTQCEAQGFRRITYYPDRPDVMARFRVRIEAEKSRYPVLLSNGNPIARGDIEAGAENAGDGTRHFVTWEDPHPKPSYLFALVAGDLACISEPFVTASGREVSLQIYVEAHNADKCAHAMRSLKKAMRWDETVFGLEYDLDIYMIVAVDDFNMGAMENKGLNVFNSKYVLADQKTATDRDFQNIEGVIAHEYFHNWTGNRVTCRDWFQLSLKEGLTVFRDQQFSADMNSPAVKRIEDVRMLRARQFAEDAGPTAHPVRPSAYIEINNFYTLTVYEKGAEVIRMMHTLLGADGFRKGMDLYFHRHDGQAVTCDDFASAMTDASGVNLDTFRRWYSQAGTPVLTVRMHYDTTAKTCTLTFAQSTPATPGQTHKQPTHIPVKMSLLGATGTAMPLYSDTENGAIECIVDVLESEQRVIFTQVDTVPVPSLLRGYSAPVKLSFDYSDQQLAFLIANDSDSFNRWDAGQQLALRVAVQLVEVHGKGEVLHMPEHFLDAYKSLLESGVDDALLAQALQLPDEEAIGEFFPQMDMRVLFTVRVFMVTALANFLQPTLLLHYHRCSDEGEFSLDAEAIGQRDLKNTCLNLLAHCDDRIGLSLAKTQFDNATNMSDEQAALRVLCNDDATDPQTYLARFYDRWRDQRLVIDKWFSLQAMSTRQDTLQRVKALVEHADFDLKNPNRARSLLGAFSTGNPVRFHAAEGAGYVFLSDYIIELDRINPQVAARMVGAMSRWRRYTQANQVIMQQQLQRILSTDNLSNDVYELVEKILQ